MRRRKDAANPAGVENGKGRLDEVALFESATFDQEFAQEAEKLKLVTGERGVLGDELVNGAGNGIGKALEHLDAEDVSDEAD